MANAVIITAIGGQDKPGIIAALTKAVLDVGGNLDDATMTRLRGAFANMLAATLPDGASADDLRGRLETVATQLGLYVSVEEIPDDQPEPEPDHSITVYGADHPGIVYRITSLLADRNVNITDLDTRVAGGPGNPVYIMVLQTSGGDWSALPGELAASAATELHVNVRHPTEIETEALLIMRAVS